MLTKIVNGAEVTLSQEEEDLTVSEWDSFAPMSLFGRVKAGKLQEANNECDNALKVITDLYSESEMKTWAIQEIEAINFQYDVDNLVDPKRPTPNIDWISEQKDGLPVDDVKRQALVTRILAKAALFHELSSTAVGKRHKMTDAIEDAATTEELNGITF